MKKNIMLFASLMISCGVFAGTKLITLTNAISVSSSVTGFNVLGVRYDGAGAWTIDANVEIMPRTNLTTGVTLFLAQPQIQIKVTKKEVATAAGISTLPKEGEEQYTYTPVTLSRIIVITVTNNFLPEMVMTNEMYTVTNVTENILSWETVDFEKLSPTALANAVESAAMAKAMQSIK